MDSKYLGTKDILFSIINKGETETANYAIAMYLLEHYGDIKNINILDIIKKNVYGPEKYNTIRFL